MSTTTYTADDVLESQLAVDDPERRAFYVGPLRRCLRNEPDAQIIAEFAEAERRLRGGAGGFPGTAKELLDFMFYAATELRIRNEESAT